MGKIVKQKDGNRTSKWKKNNKKVNEDWPDIAQKMKFSFNDFFSKCDKIRKKMRTCSHLLMKSLKRNFIFGAVCYFQWGIYRHWLFKLSLGELFLGSRYFKRAKESEGNIIKRTENVKNMDFQTIENTYLWQKTFIHEVVNPWKITILLH